MKIEKRIIAKLDMVYTVNKNEINGKTYLMAATEDHGKALLFSPPKWEVSNIWDSPGGCMNMVPLVKGNGDFIAIQKFFPIFKSEEACIVYVKPIDRLNDKWKVKKVLDLPFVHRINVVNNGKTNFLIASTICGGKDNIDDWSKPGAVYICAIPDNPDDEWILKPIIEGISKNHGMHITKYRGKQTIYVTGEEGVFKINVPSDLGGSWVYEKIIGSGVSDIYAADIDEDGEDELFTIEPFHGDKIVIYKYIDDKWQSIYNDEINFGHVIWGGRILNRPCLIVGGRDGIKELSFLFQEGVKPLKMKRMIIDKDIGPTSITVLHEREHEMIFSANHGLGEVAMYTIS